MKFKAMTWVAVLAALTMVGCDGGSESSSGGGGAKKIRIAVIPKGSTHEFWKSIHAGADEAAKEAGNVEVVWRGPQLENDRSSQIEVVENFLNQGIDGIVLAPLDDQALVPAVDQAAKNEIPVIIVDSGLKSDKFASFIATDNKKGGEMAGEAMVKALDGKGKIVVLRYSEGSASTMLREEGFLEAVKKAGGVEVVDATQYAGPTTETAQKAGENLLARFKNPDGSLNIDGIYTPNESSTFGMLRVLQDNKWAGKVKFIGFDSSEKLVTGLKDGEINALVVQNPQKMGYLGVKTMLDVLAKKPVEKQIDTGAVLVTAENMGTPEVAKLIAPPK